MQARVNWNKRFVFTKQGLPSYVIHSGPRSRWPRHRCRKFPLILESEALLLSVSREAIITGGFYAGQILEVARWAPLAPSSTCRHVMLNKFEYSAYIILCFICLFFFTSKTLLILTGVCVEMRRRQRRQRRLSWRRPGGRGTTAAPPCPGTYPAHQI